MPGSPPGQGSCGHRLGIENEDSRSMPLRSFSSFGTAAVLAAALFSASAARGQSFGTDFCDRLNSLVQATTSEFGQYLAKDGKRFRKPIPAPEGYKEVRVTDFRNYSAVVDLGFPRRDAADKERLRETMLALMRAVTACHPDIEPTPVETGGSLYLYYPFPHNVSVMVHTGNHQGEPAGAMELVLSVRPKNALPPAEGAPTAIQRPR
jgi:hypothetical protein